MAVYKRRYSTWHGPQTGGWARFAVIPRYAAAAGFDSRLLTAFFAACFVPWLVATGIIYVCYNPLVLTTLGAAQSVEFALDARFYHVFLRIQCVLSGLLCAITGPGLVSPDLTNHALPLYLSRPVSRSAYVGGKFSVLFLLMSAVTWVPGLLVFFLHATLAGAGWWQENLVIVRGLVGGFLLWIAVLGCWALAVSAWVKWRIVASGLFVAVPLVASGFGEMLNAILRTFWGGLLNLWYLCDVLFYFLFDLPIVRRMSRNMLGSALHGDIPPGVALLALAALAGGSLWMLRRRIVAREVVR